MNTAAAKMSLSVHALVTAAGHRAAGTSIFDPTNRSWLAALFGVTLMTTDDLAAKIAQ
jgi:hypothetical protein